MAYRLRRNCIASIIDWLNTQLFEDDWKGIRVVKEFTQVYDGTLPAMCVQFITPNSKKKEIGSGVWLKTPDMSIRIFATDNGQREDLAEWLLEKLENSVDYYEYESGGVSKELKGKISINKILKDEKELVNTENLAQEDKARHIISFSCRVVKN